MTALSIYNSHQDFKSIICSIVILAGGKCVLTDTSWMKPTQLLYCWFPVYTFSAECQSKSPLVERGSMYRNCSLIKSLNFSVDRPASEGTYVLVDIVGPHWVTVWVLREDVFKVWRDDGILLEPGNFIVGNGVS